MPHAHGALPGAQGVTGRLGGTGPYGGVAHVLTLRIAAHTAALDVIGLGFRV